jgi:5-formyltetrahydrofolate cyclo-ligase
MIAPVETVGAAKAGLRAAVIAARRSAGAERRARASAQITRRVMDLPVVGAARCVAAYVSFGTEPSTAELLAGISSRSVRVLLPVLRADLDLDWAIYDGTHHLTQGPRGVMSPDGPALGMAALAEAEVVVVPALAVDRRGHRLGRGGGSYDRALVRAAPGAVVVAPIYEGELLDHVPAEDHDRRVHLAVLPSGVHDLRARPPDGLPDGLPDGPGT